MNLYRNFLQPELYFEKPEVARFVETLSEPEIESTSSDRMQRLERDMMATDDIDDIATNLAIEAREIVSETGTIPPQFISYTDKDHRVKLNSEAKIPTTNKAVNRFLIGGKALGMSRAAQCTFFMTMQPLLENKPVFGNDVTDSCPWGILVVGSSLRGNCFVHIEQITKKEGIDFKMLDHDILREGRYKYPYSRFFHIRDHDEMGEVIEQMLKITSTVTEKECLINFATSLKALDFFGYSKHT